MDLFLDGSMRDCLNTLPKMSVFVIFIRFLDIRMIPHEHHSHSNMVTKAFGVGSDQ